MSHGRLAARGLTLIELVVALAVLSVLIAAVTPAMQVTIANAKVRGAADSVASGLSIAQAEAMRRSQYVEFLLTSAVPDASVVASASALAAGPNWMVRGMADTVRGISSPTFIRGSSANPAEPRTITNNDGAFGLAFASSGRAMRTTSSGVVATSAPTVFRITASGADRPLCVYVVPNGSVKTCDPKLPVGDFRACTPALSASACAP